MTASISGASSASAAYATQSMTNTHSPRQQAMQAVAAKLGMSMDDLKSALKSGQSLTDVAKSKGLSPDELISTIKQGLTSGNTQLSDAQATQIATRIANHKGGDHHHHHHGGPSPTDATSGSVPTSVSPSTGSTTGQLLSALA